MSLPTLSDYLAAAKPKPARQMRKSSSSAPTDQGAAVSTSEPTEDPSVRMGLVRLFDDEALPMPVHEPHLLDRATRAVVPLAVGSSRFKGAFIEPNLLRTVWHGFGEPLRVGATYVTKFGDACHPMVCTAFSSADVADFAVADSFRVAVGAVVCSVQELVPEKLVGFHFKGAEMFNQVDANTWVSSGRTLAKGDSGCPVLDDRGKWVLEFVGIRDSDQARVFTRSSMGPSPLIGALIGKKKARAHVPRPGVTPHKKRGTRRGAPRMSQADYEKRRALAEAEAGRRLTARELNQIFFHEDEAASFIDRQGGGDDDSYFERIEQYSDVYYVEHDLDRDVYHQYVSDDDDRPVWQGDANSDPSDYDEALGMSEAQYMATPAAHLPPGQRGMHHGSDPEPKHARLDDDGDEDMAPPAPAPAPAMPAFAPAPGLLAPAFVDEGMTEAWFAIHDPRDQVELACELMCVPEVARGVYRKMPPRAAIGALEAIYYKKKAPAAAAAAAAAALPKPPTKKSKADDQRQAEIDALKQKKAQLEAEGFKLRDLVVLTDDERRKFPAPTHAAMLLRKQIKTLENARTAKKNFLKKMQEREALMARAQAQVEQLAEQLSEMQMHLEEYEDKQGMNFRD